MTDVVFCLPSRRLDFTTYYLIYRGGRHLHGYRKGLFPFRLGRGSKCGHLPMIWLDVFFALETWSPRKLRGSVFPDTRLLRIPSILLTCVGAFFDKLLTNHMYFSAFPHIGKEL